MANYECQRCHRLFQRVGTEDICPACAPFDEEEFRKIKDYLMVHQGASTTEVMRETGVSLSQIKRYLREERLEIVGDNKGFIRCEKCGAPINSGRLCQSCYREANSQRIVGVKTNRVEDTNIGEKFKYLNGRKK